MLDDFVFFSLARSPQIHEVCSEPSQGRCKVVQRRREIVAETGVAQIHLEKDMPRLLSSVVIVPVHDIVQLCTVGVAVVISPVTVGSLDVVSNGKNKNRKFCAVSFKWRSPNL